jgi:hypothetical protein
MAITTNSSMSVNAGRAGVAAQCLGRLIARALFIAELLGCPQKPDCPCFS